LRLKPTAILAPESVHKDPPGPNSAVQALCEFGWLAAWAAEVGDITTRDGLLRHADRFMAPRWEDGGYYYPRHDARFDASGNYTFMDPATGNAILGFARLNRGGDLATLYNEPLDEAHYSAPMLDDLSTAMDLLEARYDRDDETLRFTIAPWKGSSDHDAAITLSNVSDRGRWTLLRSGEVVAEGHGATGEANCDIGIVSATDGKLVIRVDVPQTTHFEMIWH